MEKTTTQTIYQKMQRI